MNDHQNEAILRVEKAEFMLVVQLVNISRVAFLGIFNFEVMPSIYRKATFRTFHLYTPLDNIWSFLIVDMLEDH